MLLFLAGLVISPTTPVEYALLTALASKGTETEAFTWAGTAVYLGFAGGSALTGSVLSSTLGTARGLTVSTLVVTALVVAGAALAVASPLIVPSVKSEVFAPGDGIPYRA